MKLTSKRRPLGQQVGALKGAYPDAEVSFSRQTIVWVGHLQPTPLSRVYRAHLEYQPQHGRPKVTVVDPPLELAAGKTSLPHVFPGDELCLHLFGEWNHSRLLTDIIPWASEWLYFYELWLATGDWLGGGEHPHRKVKEKRAAPHGEERSLR